jgi:hypothetical protein
MVKCYRSMFNINGEELNMMRLGVMGLCCK